MTIPSTGPFSSSDIRTEFGLPSSFSSSDLYRNGSYVPGSTTETELSNCNSQYSPFFPQYQVSSVGEAPSEFESGTWNGDAVDLDTISGGLIYSRGAFQEIDSPFWKYSIVRCNASEETVDINTTVPTSGPMNSSQFRGTENA